MIWSYRYPTLESLQYLDTVDYNLSKMVYLDLGLCSLHHRNADLNCTSIWCDLIPQLRAILFVIKGIFSSRILFYYKKPQITNTVAPVCNAANTSKTTKKATTVRGVATMRKKGA